MAQQEYFGRAAEELGITQSGLSQMIKGLEHSIGARLVERTTRSVSLTEMTSDRRLTQLKSGEIDVGVMRDRQLWTTARRSAARGGGDNQSCHRPTSALTLLSDATRGLAIAVIHDQQS